MAFVSEPQDPRVIRRVWEKARIHSWLDPVEWRLDCHGALIRFSEYGRRHVAVGWGIDHVVSTEEGGSEDVDNLRPMNFLNEGPPARELKNIGMDAESASFPMDS